MVKIVLQDAEILAIEVVQWDVLRNVNLDALQIVLVNVKEVVKILVKMDVLQHVFLAVQILVWKLALKAAEIIVELYAA